ncbi:MAG: AI-2E family transporter [bacterium]
MVTNHPKVSESASPKSSWSFQKSMPSSQTLLAGIFLLLLIAAIYFAQTILIPVSLAFFLYMVLHPAARVLRRMHIPTMLGAAIIVILLMGIVTFATLQLIGPAQDWISNAPDRISKIERKVQNLLKPVEEVRRAAEEIGNIGQQDKNKREVKLTDHSFTNQILSSTQTLVGHGIVIMILLFFLLASGDGIWTMPSKWCASKIDHSSFMKIIHNIESRLSSYLFTVVLINISVGAIIGVAMFFLGLPNPVLWGVMAGMVNFIPYVGPLIGEVVVGMVALFTFTDVGHALLAPLFYLCLTFVEGNFITPMILGRHFTISPLLIVVSMILWGWLWGIMGLFLAVPVLMLFTILMESVSSIPLKPTAAPPLYEQHPMEFKS